MRTALALILLLLVPSLALGQGTRPFYLDGGATIPLGDFGDTWSTGFNVGGGAAFPLRPGLALRADLSYSRFGLDQEAFLVDAGVPAGATGFEIAGADLSTFSALGLLQWYLAPADRPYRPYLLGGFGYWRSTLGDLTIRDPSGAQRLEGDSNNGVAGALGAGFTIALQPTLGLFIEGRYMAGWDFGDPPDLDDSYLPLKLGVVFNP